MSENLNCSTEGFSKYDSMSIGELEEILRADAMGPERDDSDVDEILYVMEVLAKKRRQNGIAGKTALEAYQEFQQHYLPMDKEEPKRKSNVIPFRRIAAVAASIVLVFSLATSANAFSFRDVWDAVVTWAQETFSFSMGVEVSEPNKDDNQEYITFQDALIECQIDPNLVPIYVPDGFALDDVIIDQNPLQLKCIALYVCDNRAIKVTVQTYQDTIPEQFEKSNELFEVYSQYGTDYYIFTNNKLFQAAWVHSGYECSIVGDLDYHEVKAMIDSIEKG